MAKFLMIHLDAGYPKKRMLIPADNPEMVKMFLAAPVVAEAFDGKKMVIARTGESITIQLVDLDIDNLPHFDEVVSEREKVNSNA